MKRGGRLETVVHPFEPVYDERSVILILGSLPSVQSRANEFYYGHPQNRFWRVLAALADSAVPQTVDEKRRFLLERRIALWDVIQECEIAGSSDAAIRNAVPNDLRPLLERAPIRRLFANGAAACSLYNRLCRPICGREITKLPSTSPANAAYSPERLCEAWRSVWEAAQVL